MKKRLQIILLNHYLIVAVYFIILLCVYSQIGLNQFGTDDGIFRETAQHTSPIEFALERYTTWSSRLAADALIILFFRYFEIFIPLLGALVNATLPLVILFLVTNKRFDRLPVIYLFFSIGIFELMPFNVKAYGMYWKTGLFNYALPVLLAIFVLVYLKRWFIDGKQQNVFMPAILALLTFFFNEQVGLTLLAITLLCFASDVAINAYKKRDRSVIQLTRSLVNKRYFQPSVMLTACAIGLVIVLLAPGNAIRTLSETATWNPAFADMQLFEKIVRGFAWMSSKLILSNLLLPFAVLTALGFKKLDRDTLFTCALIIGAFVSQLIMFFSPTMWASGDRIHFIFYTLLISTSTWAIVNIENRISRSLFFIVVLLGSITAAYHWGKVIIG